MNHIILGQCKKNKRTEYLILWKGKPKSEATKEKDTTLWQFER